MSRFHSHISSAIKIIESYDGVGPFAFHLKKHFAANKKYGSKDRRTIASLCYDYFRAGNALKDKTTAEKVLAGLFLCEVSIHPLLEALAPSLNDHITLSPEEKLAYLHIDSLNIFPFVNELSAEVKNTAFCLSFLKQPKLFLRIRPNKKNTVVNKLTAATIPFNILEDDCIELENAIDLENIIKINKEAVVQDASSQKVFDYFDSKSFDIQDKIITAWDCCAASGGKSILLHDKLKGAVQLTVSDIRENILVNCKVRMQQAGVRIYKSLVTDLSKDTAEIATDTFSIIICDVPCTGSGTWARTPEQLLFFKQLAIEEYVGKQKLIAQHAAAQLSKGGIFFYITCSVFKKENEEVVEYLQEKCKLQLIQMEYIKGYEMQADTMFVAIFTV